VSEEITKSLKVMQTYDCETGLVVLAVSLDDLNKVLKTMDNQAKRLNRRLERLTKAGDAMADNCQAMAGVEDENGDCCYSSDLMSFVQDWRDAKEGKQP